MTVKARSIAAAAALCLTFPGGASAQVGSESYQFLKAVTDGDGQKVLDILNKPGSTIINSKDQTTGQGALHIAVKRGDTTYILFLLQHGADPNIRDAAGTTPLMLAVTEGQGECIDPLIAGRANVNLANDRGETPLIRAVQRRDVALVRELLADGANPDQTDNLAGKSARDYADADTRTPAIAKLLDAAPKQVHRSISGPQL